NRREMPTEVVTFRECAGGLEVHLSALPMIDLYVAQLHAGRIVGFGKTGRSKLRPINTFSGTGIELAGAGVQAALEFRCAWKGILQVGARARNVPGEPRRTE